MSKPRVVAAMSGGVDSAVAAGLLVEAGYDVVGVTMKMYEPKRGPHARSCCGSEDFDDARRSASILGIPHYVLDYTEEFQRGVIDNFIDEYESGRTPNPCVSCNNHVKLGTLRRYAASVDAAYLATGHYARLIHSEDGPHLYHTANVKDQAYALSGLRRDQLAQLLLPIGLLEKETTRNEARRLGLPVAEKLESQDICFVEGGDYRDVLAERGKTTNPTPGEIHSIDGKVLGLHTGIRAYTVGQRARLGGSAAPLYVTRIDAESHTVVVGTREHLESSSLIAERPNILQAERFTAPLRAKAMIRSHAQPAGVLVTLSDNCKTLSLTFDEPQQAVTPGQLLVVLDAETDEVLASATIT
jgi:tRNA-specific 2-thiouridylase